MTVEEIENQIKELEKLKKQELLNERAKDLSVVKTLCSKHGFTERMLKGFLQTGRVRRTKEELAKVS